MTWLRSIAITAIGLALLALASHVALRALRPHWLLALNAIPGAEPIDAATLERLAAAGEVERWPIEPGRSASEWIVQACAGRDLPTSPVGKPITGDLKITRDHTDAVLCRVLAANEPVEINRFLARVVPGQIPGSSWLLSNGDWDFGEITLVELLYLAGDDPEKLFPETRERLVSSLLVERGATPQLYVPRTTGLVYDTENHILMREVTRTLRNQWLRRLDSDDPSTDNRASGLEDWLLAYLNHIRLHGFYEFNSIPYETYHLKPLLILEAFTDSSRVRTLVRAILDERFRRWSLGSLGLRQCAPFRRQWRRRHDDRLTLSRMSNLALTWLGRVDRDGNADFPEPHGFRPSLEGALLPYRPPADAMRFALEKDRHYYARIGHRVNGSPEIYSGGPGYLLSAGGVFRGVYHKLIPRPTALLIEDGASTLDQLIHIRGRGSLRSWNNTGVYVRFAVGNSPVHVPSHLEPIELDGSWQAFAFGERLSVVTYSAPDLGLIAILPKSYRSEMLRQVVARNPDRQTLRTRFVWPSGAEVEYEVDAPPGTWVIAKADGRALDRDYDRWPLLSEESAKWMGARP